MKAAFKKTPGATEFDMQTHSGKIKKYRKYGMLTFPIGKTACSLAVYQSILMMQDKDYEGSLFIPFNDLTNYEGTFGGGRYMDIHEADVESGTITIDFNKAYNPYCAYAEGYSCPIPPDENRLQVRVEAGEKMASE